MTQAPWDAAPVSPATGAPRRSRRPSLAWQVSAVTMVVVALTVTVIALLASFSARSSQTDAKRGALALRADKFALATAAGRGTQAVDRLKNQAGLANVKLAWIRAGNGNVFGPDPLARASIRPEDIVAAQNGQDVSDVRSVEGRDVFFEARPAVGAADAAIVLVQPVRQAADPYARSLRQTLLPLLVGLVLAAGAGVFLGRRLTRPLQQVASAAHELAAGRRDVHVPVSGSPEVTDVAEALNGLVGALTSSEGRQREFLLSVSHELRTPLTALRGFAEALSDDVTAPADVPHTGRVMLAEAQRLQRLVSDLLDLARLGAQDFRLDQADVDLTALIEAAGAVWGARCAAEGVDFRLDAPVAPLLAHTDPTRVRQIVDGLAENALRVTPSGRPIVLTAYPVDGWCVVEIRDGGPGLTDDDLAVAFDRSELYNRYRGIRQVGTGLGLALVGGLAARLGGAARASRAPEGGACFSVWLPAVS